MDGVTLSRKHQAELISMLPMEFNYACDMAMTCGLATEIYEIKFKQFNLTKIKHNKFYTHFEYNFSPSLYHVTFYNKVKDPNVHILVR